MACCACQTPAVEQCRTQLNTSDLAELVYIAGLDANLCYRFQEIAEIFDLRDCAGNPITANAQIVLCSDFQNRLCAALAALADGGALTLGVTEVVGADCFTYTVPETQFVANDSNTIDFTTAGAFGHTLTGVVRISAEPGNDLVALADGLYVDALSCAQLGLLPSGGAAVLNSTQLVGADCELYTVPETPITVVDTITVDLTSSGAFGHTLQADVNISSVVGNQIVLQPDGLYVPPTDGLSCADIALLPVGPVAIPGVTQLLGSDCQLHTIPIPGSTDVEITGLDTSCFDITVVEVVPNVFTISGTPVISPNADNALSCLPNGLFVNEVELTAGDGDCVDVQVIDNGNGDWTIVADAVISPDFGNALECRENGLFSNVVPLLVDDTNCIALSLIGATLTANPIISPAANNGLQCLADGLFVDDTDITAVDTPSVNITVSGADNHTIQADVNISACVGNIITIQPDGLCAQVGAADLTVEDTDCIALAYVDDTLTATPIIADTYPGFPAACNPLLCTVDGLAVPPEHTSEAGSVIGATPTHDGPLNGGAGAAQNITINFTNPSDCRSAAVTLVLGMGQVNVSGEAAPNDRIIDITLLADFNIPGVIVSGGFIAVNEAQIDTRGHTAPEQVPGSDYAEVHKVQTFEIGPGVACSVELRMEVENAGLDGTTQLYAGPPYLAYHMTTI